MSEEKQNNPLIGMESLKFRDELLSEFKEIKTKLDTVFQRDIAIQKELDRAEQRDRMIMWVSLISVGFGYTAGIVVTNPQNPLWIIGVCLLVFGFIGAILRWNPGWHYRK